VGSPHQTARHLDSAGMEQRPRDHWARFRCQNRKGGLQIFGFGALKARKKTRRHGDLSQGLLASRDLVRAARLEGESFGTPGGFAVGFETLQRTVRVRLADSSGAHPLFD